MRLFPRTRQFQLESLESRRLLNALTVSNAADSGVGSLRAQIAAAQNGDTVTFAPGLAGQTITLSSGEIAFAKSLTIQGLGANQLTISGAFRSLAPSQIFRITGVANEVAIRDLAITGAWGSAIVNDATLTVSGCNLFDNSTLHYFPSNWAGGNGGAIHNSGTLTVNNSTLSGNRAVAKGGGNGGAIFNSGTLTITGSSLSGNTAEVGGGAIYNHHGTATISGCNVSGNIATGGGGAISTSWGAVTVSNCTIANNHAIQGTYYIYDDEGNVITSVGGDAVGGGVFVEQGGTLAIDHSTLAGNRATGGAGDPGYEGTGYGGALYGSPVRLYNTIIAGNNADEGPDLNAGVTSLGHNLIGNPSAASGFVATDLLNVNPLLGPLQNNGGPTHTMALLAGSPAINAGHNTGAPAYDQRGAGFPRIVGGTIDIGAVESGGGSGPGKTWIGPGGAGSGGDWFIAANWSPSGAPTASDHVTISGKSVTLSAGAAVANLALTGGAMLTLGSNGNRTLRTSGLSISADSGLNLNDNDLILDYGSAAGANASLLGSWNGSLYTGVTGLIARGYNFSAWDGSGLVTTMADARAGLTTLAPAEAADVLSITGNQTALWQGQTVDATTVIVKYTYAGDVNLDGLVDAADYGVIDNWVQFPGTDGYFNGDFNYDGVIDAGDYGIIDNSIQMQGSPL